MNDLKEYLIPFVGLKTGKHQFDYQIDNTFFKSFDYDEFNDVSVKVDIVLEKKSTMLELDFKHKGTVNVPCDVSGEEFDLPIKGKLKLLVKFGDAFNDENEELLILPHGEFQVNVAQYIYEYGHVPSNLTATDYDNADSMLPVEEGVTYQQCSLDDAGKQKLIFTQDAKRIYYTDDDGQSFDEIY